MLKMYRSGFVTAGSFWNMAVPEGIDFYYEITQWESGKIFHYRYLLDGSSDVLCAKALGNDEDDAAKKTAQSKKAGKKGAKTAPTDVEEKRKTVDPQEMRLRWRRMRAFNFISFCIMFTLFFIYRRLK